MKYFKCAGCDIYLKKVTDRKKMIVTEEEMDCFSSSLKITIDVNDILCRKWRLSIYKNNNYVKDTELEADSTFDPSFAIEVKRN